MRGKGPDGIEIPKTEATTVGGTTDEIEINDVAANKAFGNSVKYYNTFDISWEISCDDGKNWEAAGSSKNPVYVCLKGPSADAVALRSVVHLACSVGNATSATPDQVVANTWSQLTGASFKAWNESAQSWNRTIYYYRAGTSFTAVSYTHLTLPTKA